MTDQSEQDSSQEAYYHHQQLMRQQEIEAAIAAFEKAREAYWQAIDRPVWSVK